MTKRIFALLVALTMISSAVAGLSAVTASASETSGTVVRLDPSDASPFNNGEFQGWGTALCWWANRLGYSEKLTRQAADAFFSEDGLGLDIARYNLGGGDDPEHNHITRSDSKVPGVWDEFELSSDGKDVNITKYDITNDQNQLNIAKAALKANPDLYFEGFSNSAPYFMTVTGCTSGGAVSTRTNSKGETEYYSNENNLKDDFYDDFAKFIADATLLFKDEGIVFQSYSPMNEPDTGYWFEGSGKQEGCHLDPGEKQSKMIVETRKALDEAGLTNVLVAGMDETSLKSTANNLGSLTAEAKTALGRVDTHTYSDRGYHAQVKAKALELNKNLWQSEVDKGGDGFTLASMIIEDMNGMQPSAWVMWDIVDKHRDANFTAPDGSHPEANATLNATDSLWGVGMGNHDTETLELANKYYFYGQFTRYINPGDTIIASSSNTLAAYNKKSGDIKIVALNSSGSDQKYTFDLTPFTYVGDDVKEIRTNNLTGANAEHWKEIKDEAALADKKLTTTLKAGTVTTYVIGSSAVTKFDASGEKAEYSYNVPSAYNDCDKYFAIYDGTTLKALTKNESEKTLTGDFTGCAFRLLVWDGMEPVMSIDTVTAANDVKYAVIKGGGDEIGLNSSVTLTVEKNIEGTVEWSVSDDNVASIDQNGTVTAIANGKFTVYAKIGDFTASKDFTVPSYKLTGTASWNNDKNVPADSADYTKAADGDLSTYFDGTKGGYVQYDYGTPFKASSIKLAARSGNGMADRTKGGKVQGSNDGYEWTDLYTISAAIPADSYTTLSASDLANNKAYRYYRYTNNDDMANIAEFLIEGDESDDTPENAPVVTDIAGFTDDFEGNANIFNASLGALSDTGNTVFASGLARFGKVFAPIKSTATATLADPITLTTKDKFRLTFNMFAGWESGGKENTFAIKDKDGAEIVAIKLTGGGYNLNQVRVGGENVLEASAISQCKTSADGKGANEWNHASQPYRNYVGYNKYVEITIDGAGNVTVDVTGGLADTSVTGTLSGTVTLGSIEATGDYNTKPSCTVTYDNLDGDLITYAETFALPTPPLDPTDPPVLPSSGELISMSFDDGTLASTSTYGKATGSPKFVTEDEKKCIQFDGTSATAVTLTDANGNPLLKGHKNLTISFKVKPTATGTSWWLYAANDNTGRSESNLKYLGVLEQNDKLTIERYNASRAAGPSGNVLELNKWHDVLVSVGDDVTSLYVDGNFVGSESSSVNITDILGNNSVTYIGRANWGSGEYATGYLDDFVIYNYALDSVLASLDLGDTSAVTENIDLPQTIDGTAIAWSTSDATVVTNTGSVTRADDTKTATLTASVVVNGVTLTKTFDVTVKGKTAVLDTFAAYAENGSIKFTSDWTSGEAYGITVTIASIDVEPLYTNQIENTASGVFDSLANGTYKVHCAMNGKTVIRTVIVKDEIETGAYLFAHFIGDEKNATDEQLYFTVSTDGEAWTTLNGGNAVLTSTQSQKGIRDPFILRGKDGEYIIIATDLSIKNGGLNWTTSQSQGSRNIVVWKSTDLKNWTYSLKEVMPAGTGCVWAPEAFYDPDKEAYMVFWASKTSADNYGKQRVYRSYTTDFDTFTSPELYIEKDHSMIDTTIISDKGIYYRFTKDETDKFIFMESSACLDGPWTEVSTFNQNGKDGYEGPTIFKMNGEQKWCLMLDKHNNGGYIPFTATDLSTGVFTRANNVTFNTSYEYRHGTVMPITTAEYNALLAAYPNN